MSEKVKVLYFIDRMLKGGIQSFVIEIIKNIDKEKIQIDFLLLDDGNKYELEDELKKLGCKVFKLEGMWVRKTTDFIKYNKVLDDFFKQHNDYKVVHLHSSSKNYMVLKKAKKYGIPMRIAHSHNIDFQTQNPVKKFIGNIFKIFLKKYSTNFFACSKLAGEWLFGKKIVNSNKFQVIHNAIDYNRFKFNQEKRENIRRELNVKDNEVLVGHIGRFTNQKNHEFLIDIFDEMVKQNSNCKLLMIGKGEKEQIIKDKVKNLNLENKVIFEGFKDDVSGYLNAMDYFVFPSLYEGLGIVLIEAQANGLKCFTSKDVVPLDAKVTPQLQYIKLEDSSFKWSSIILSNNKDRQNTYEFFKESKYFIQDTVEILNKQYLNID